MCSGSLVVEVGTCGLAPPSLSEQEEGGWLARHGTSTRWARVIAQTFGHGQRAVSGGGHHLEVVEEELALDDNCLQIRQTRRAPENVNRANM